MRNYRCYEEFPYFEMKRCNNGCSHKCDPCEHCYNPCNKIPHKNCDCFPPMNCFPLKPNLKHLECNYNNCELLYLMYGILIGKSLD